MTRHSPTRTTIIVVIACVMAVAVGCAESQSVPETMTTGPVMTGNLATIDSLVSANHGRWVMVNIWATWCRPCVAETPDLVAFANEMKDKPFTMIGLSTDYFTVDDTTAVRKVRAFQTKHSVPYTNLVFLGSTQELTDHYELSGALPTTLVFDPAGKVAEQHIGLIEAADLEVIGKRIGGA